MAKNTVQLAVALALLCLAVLARFLPHAPNFTPIIALALFGAFYLPKKLALALPLIAMFLSDLFIGFYVWPVMASVYGSFLLAGFLGLFLKKYQKRYAVPGGAFLGALLFFLLTNLAVFLFTPLYPKTLLGLWQCYFLALPFFKNTLLSALFYSVCLFSFYELLRLVLGRCFCLSFNKIFFRTAGR